MLQMRLMNHLRKTADGQWEVRIVVPADCRERIGKSNLTRRLGRVTKSEANRLSADIVAEFKAQIEKARQPPPPLTKINPNQAIAALGRWRDTEIARVRVERFNEPGYGFPSEMSKVGAWVEHSGKLGRDRHKTRQRLSAGSLRSLVRGSIKLCEWELCRDRPAVSGIGRADARCLS